MENKLLSALIIILSIFWIFNVTISAFAGATEDVIFKQKTGNVSHKYPTQVTPAGFTFLIWNLIFLWVIIGNFFLIFCMFKSSKDGSGKILFKPQVLTIPIVITMIINCCFYTSWLFVWDNEYMTVSSVILFCIMGTNWLALGLFAYRILVLNSLALYTTWTTIAALLNLSIALIYDGKIEDPTPSLIALGLLTAVLTVWIPLDVFFLDNYCRYMLTPLFVVLWGLAGIFSNLQKKELEDGTTKNFTIGLIGVTSILYLGRVLLTIFRAIKFPLK